MKRTFWIGAATVFASMVMGVSGLQARIVLPHVLSDGMVLQRQTDVNIWGKASPDSKITVAPGWDGKRYTATVGTDSMWTVSIPTPEAGGPYEIKISDNKGDNVSLSDVLIGEVWLCAGQSNMEMPMHGFDRQPLKGTNGIIAKAKPSVPLRIFTTDRTTNGWVRNSSKTPEWDIAGEWWDNSPLHVANASAVGYLFARYLNEVLDVPVGIIVTTLGGSRIEPWLSREAISQFPDYNLAHLGQDADGNPWNDPCLLYNAKINPFVNYGMRGFLWYQGESNRHNAAVYDRLMSAMVADWRARWAADGDAMPFYFVEIAPFKYEGVDGVSAPRLIEAQNRAAGTIPNSGIVSTVDIGNYNFIHPVDKITVGERLAWLALTDTYGMTGFGSHSPQYESMEIKDGKIYINVTNAPDGLCPMWTSLSGFEIAGADRKFYPAFAEVEESTCRLAVSSENVPEPVAVRYCYKNVPEPSVYNVPGLPLLPFRTDDWE